jgi:hypothetical protein
MVITCNFTTSIVWLCRSIHDFAFIPPTMVHPPPLDYWCVFDIGTHFAYLSRVCKKTLLSTVMAVGWINTLEVILQNLKWGTEYWLWYTFVSTLLNVTIISNTTERL